MNSPPEPDQTTAALPAASAGSVRASTAPTVSPVLSSPDEDEDWLKNATVDASEQKKKKNKKKSKGQNECETVAM